MGDFRADLMWNPRAEGPSDDDTRAATPNHTRPSVIVTSELVPSDPCFRFVALLAWLFGTLFRLQVRLELELCGVFRVGR
jgi:hypothetical protein